MSQLDYPRQLIQYLSIPYVDGGRDIAVDGGLDCWGLVRAARYAVYNKNLLPLYDAVDRFSKLDFTRSARQTMNALREIDTLEAGAVIAVLNRSVCIHVALVIDNNNQPAILDTNPKVNAKVHKWREFKRLFFNCELKIYD